MQQVQYWTIRKHRIQILRTKWNCTRMAHNPKIVILLNSSTWHVIYLSCHCNKKLQSFKILHLNTVKY